MRIEKNGFLWGKIEGGNIKVKLTPEFLEGVGDGEEVVILTKHNWMYIREKTGLLAESLKNFGCTICGDKAEYQAVPTHMSIARTPFLCKEHMQEVSITEKIEDNEFFERILDE